MLQIIVITQQLLNLMIRWCQIGVEPSASSTESSTNNHVAFNPEITSEEYGRGRTGLVVRTSDYGSGDPGSILGRVGVLFP